MAVENFTTYTEDDPNGRYTVTATKVTVTAETDRSTNIGSVSKDYGTGYFSGDFDHYFDVNNSTASGFWPINMTWTLSNILGGYQTVTTCLMVYILAANLQLLEKLDGVEYTTIYSFIMTLDTTCYCRVWRDDDETTYGTLYFEVYPTSADRVAKTNILFTDHLHLHAQLDYRYISATMGWPYRESDDARTFFVENLNLNGPSTGTNMQLNVSDIFKTVTAGQLNIGDVWKPVTGAQVNISDSWKKVF